MHGGSQKLKLRCSHTGLPVANHHRAQTLSIEITSVTSGGVFVDCGLVSRYQPISAHGIRRMKDCSSHHQLMLKFAFDSETSAVSKCQIVSLCVHQTWGKRLIIPPTYCESDLEQLLFTQVHHRAADASFQ